MAIRTVRSRLPAIALLVIVALLATTLPAQTPDPLTAQPRGSVEGAVFDSIAGAALSGAIVQLVAAADLSRVSGSTTTDSDGRFALLDVPPGVYVIGFLHPLIDSLGLQPLSRRVVVEPGRTVRAELATPSAGHFVDVACSTTTTTGPNAAVVGVARDARDGSPVAGAEVTAEWLELTLRTGGVTPRRPRRSAITHSNGWFAVCDVPTVGTIGLLAKRGADSTDLIELPAPANRLLRRDLYLGPANPATDATARPGPDAPSRQVPAPRTGPGQLRGVVVSATRGAPIVGALVGVAGGVQTRTDEQGEWAIASAPLGTRILEVRALGHAPERAAVDILPGTGPIRVELSTVEAILDTVHVRAARMMDAHMAGFAERSRTGMGRYLTQEEIARRQPHVMSDLLRNIPGLRVETAQLGDTEIRMRGIFDETCVPSVYVNAHNMGTLSAEGIDDWVRPLDVIGVEVYPPGTAPPEFEPGLSGCGAIVIWSRPSTVAAPQRSIGRRLAIAGGVGALALLLLALGQR